MIPFILAGFFFAAAVYSLGWYNGFGAGESHVTSGIEVVIPEVLPPRSISNYPVRYGTSVKMNNLYN